MLLLMLILLLLHANPVEAASLPPSPADDEFDDAQSPVLQLEIRMPLAADGSSCMWAPAAFRE
jgi:hypothetical protein